MMDSGNEIQTVSPCGASDGLLSHETRGSEHSEPSVVQFSLPHCLELFGIGGLEAKRVEANVAWRVAFFDRPWLRPFERIGEASLGVTWGMGGYFQWIRGENHLGIERRAWHPFVGNGSLIAASPGPKWNDKLSNLAQEGVAETDAVDTQRFLYLSLIAINFAGLFIASAAVMLGCFWQYAAWPCDAALSEQQTNADRTKNVRTAKRGYKYKPVPSG